MDFKTILASLLPVLEPLILEEWATVALPFLQAQVAKVTQPDELVVAQALLVFLDTVAKTEITKL